ncbi:isochorismatase family protein [Umezawaea sp. Da 62-37]|uniref:isochorismatase family protein n=1 Tax=Umezawaea sp. Da 62-37 TaxID=3075927 RepID=UPI0028F74E65|nr:isochorismatase family protein [Umezawaea sp. Da 62-37]WNV89329.1 isochorismatase family protein [Umezawaea sp. Da 62-37]
MPVTTLDPKTALVVVDLQKGVVGMPAAHPVDQVVKNSAALADAFRAHGLPVVIVTVDGVAPGRTDQNRPAVEFPAEWLELVPELNRQPGDHAVTKRTWGAFTGTDLDAHLKGEGVTQVVVVGVATSAGVESTARHAHELGYHVTLAVDAMTDMSREAHDHSVAQIFPKIGETGTTEEIIDLVTSGNGRS